uniref:Sulfotransferase n=1 Tax=Gossypium raimondii TaxID=29730 RepID=A0A0D2QFG2_GOSRA|nr:hypothetical protein B456_003G042200 [Gossypium raimondii]
METSKTFPSVETPDEGQLFQYHGFWISSFGIKGSLLIHDHFKPRSTDIIVATYPKYGTTWLKAFVFSIINKAPFDFSDHPLHKVNPQDLVPFFEGITCKDGSTSFVDGIPSPRLLSTHLPYSLFPTRMTDDTMACRFLYVCRYPKDVLVSKWHFVNKLRPKKLPPLSLEETFDLFCKGDHILGYWKASVELPKKVLFLKYEDVKKEPLGCVRKVAEFLGVPFTPEEENNEIVEQIVKLCSFESMSNQDVNKLDKRYQQRPVSNSDFFKKGEVGDWVNHLSPEMAEKLDQITEEKLQDTGFNFH